VTPGPGVFRSEDADIGYDQSVAGDRALYHVGKDCDNPFIELKINDIPQGGSIDGIVFMGQSLLVLSKLAVSKRGEDIFSAAEHQELGEVKREIHREAGAFSRRSGGTACSEAVMPLFLIWLVMGMPNKAR
jgi:hypothetical protein